MNQSPELLCCVREGDDFANILFCVTSVSEVCAKHGDEGWNVWWRASCGVHQINEGLLAAIDVVSFDFGANVVHQLAVVVVKVVLGVASMVDFDAVHVSEIRVRKPGI